MNLLLDTHILIWWSTDDPALPDQCRVMLADPRNEVYFSSVAIWEVSIKHSRGKLAMPPEMLHQQSSKAGLVELPFTAKHAAAVKSLPWIHRDPFDRALIAQALSEPLVLVSQDHNIRKYPVSVEHF